MLTAVYHVDPRRVHSLYSSKYKKGWLRKSFRENNGYGILQRRAAKHLGAHMVYRETFFANSDAVFISTLSSRIASMEFVNRRAAPFVPQLVKSDTRTPQNQDPEMLSHSIHGHPTMAVIFLGLASPLNLLVQTFSTPVCPRLGSSTSSKFPELLNTKCMANSLRCSAADREFRTPWTSVTPIKTNASSSQCEAQLYILDQTSEAGWSTVDHLRSLRRWDTWYFEPTEMCWMGCLMRGLIWTHKSKVKHVSHFKTRKSVWTRNQRKFRSWKNGIIFTDSFYIRMLYDVFLTPHFSPINRIQWWCRRDHARPRHYSETSRSSGGEIEADDSGIRYRSGTESVSDCLWFGCIIQPDDIFGSKVQISDRSGSLTN